VPNTYLDIDTTTGRLQRTSAIASSSGGTDANKLVATNSDGKIDESLLDSAVLDGGGDLITATEALAAGDWVTIYVSSGTRRCKKALAADATRPAHGFVREAWTLGQSAKVFRAGTNGNVAASGMSTADIGKMVFLSAATDGGSTLTPPSSVGNLIQRVGYLVDVVSTVSVQMELGDEILL